MIEEILFVGGPISHETRFVRNDIETFQISIPFKIKEPISIEEQIETTISEKLKLHYYHRRRCYFNDGNSYLEVFAHTLFDFGDVMIELLSFYAENGFKPIIKKKDNL